MNNPLDKVYLDEAMLDVVAGGGSVSSGSDTYTADENTIYMVPDEIGDLVQTTGTSSSDVMSQKAVTDALADKVDKTTSANKVYATDNSGNQTTLSIGTANGNATIYRDSSSGSSMPDGYLVSHDPSNSYHVATKKYADERVTANPSGTSSTDLTKISIGGTVYNIPSGGSSNLPITVVDYSTSGIIFNFNDYTTPGLYFVSAYNFNNGPSFITTTSTNSPYTFWLEVECDQSLHITTQKVDFKNQIGNRSAVGISTLVWGAWSERSYIYIPTAVNSDTATTDLNRITINGTVYNVEKPPKLLTCSTTATTYSKTVSYSNFRLVIGSIITVKFTNAHNSSTAATLNVNSTGAKTIVWDNTGYNVTQTTTSTATRCNSWQAGEILTLEYDGTYWRIIARSKPTVYSATGTKSATYGSDVEVASFTVAAGKVYQISAWVESSISVDTSIVNCQIIVKDINGNVVTAVNSRGPMASGGGVTSTKLVDLTSQTSYCTVNLISYGYYNGSYVLEGYLNAVSVVE